MGTPAENVALIRTFEDKFVDGDLDYVLTMLTEDIVVHECSNVPYPGEHRGKDGFLALARAFEDVWEFRSPLSLELLPAGEHKVLGLVKFDVIAKPTGRPLTLRVAEIYTIRDGKIADILIHYWDTAAMSAATDGIKLLPGTASDEWSPLDPSVHEVGGRA